MKPIRTRKPVEEFPSEITSEGVLKASKKLCPARAQPLIPKIFHHIWIDFGTGKKPTEFHQNLTKRLLDLHPGWEHILWHESEIIEQIKEHVPFFLSTFLSYKRPIKRHNSARLVILYAMGGVYLDHDYIPLKSIEPALGSCKTIFISEKYEGAFVPTNSLMGSVAKNPFFSFALDKMTTPEYVRINSGATGVRQFGMALKAFIKKERPTRFKLYHPKFFNPFSWDEGAERIKKYTLEDVKSRFPDCIFYQFFEAAWLNL